MKFPGGHKLGMWGGLLFNLIFDLKTLKEKQATELCFVKRETNTVYMIQGARISLKL